MLPGVKELQLTTPPTMITVMEVRDVSDARFVTKETMSSSCDALSGVKAGTGVVQGVETRDLGIWKRRMQALMQLETSVCGGSGTLA